MPNKSPGIILKIKTHHSYQKNILVWVSSALGLTPFTFSILHRRLNYYDKKIEKLFFSFLLYVIFASKNFNTKKT